MSAYDYETATHLARQDVPFYALVMAAMLRADTTNVAKLRLAWPRVWEELQARYDAPGGRIGSEATVEESSLQDPRD